MLLRTLNAAHFALYLTVLYGLGLAAVIYLVSDNNALASLGYSSVTVGSYWLGQGLVALLQKGSRRSRTLD